MDKIKEFYSIYPRVEGRYYSFDKVRRQWSTEVLMNAANESDIILAVKNFAKNPPEYIKNPENWLSDKMYQEPDLLNPIKEEKPLNGWKEKLAKHIGEVPVKMWFDGAKVINGKLIVDDPKKLNWIKQKYDIALSNIGVSI